MTSLWIAFAVLLLPAIWLLILPLRQARALHDAQRDYEANDTTAEQNVAIYKRRLASLEAAKERGDIDEERFAEDRLELERSLLEDTTTVKRRPLKTYASGRFVVPLLLLAVIGASVIWYQHHGAEGDLVLLQTQRDVQNHPEGSMAMYLERMEEQAMLQPDNPNVWSELFPLYRQTGQAEKAVDALERLIAIEGRVAPLLAQLAQLRFFLEGRALTPEVQGLVDETLEQDPRQPTILGMMGIHAFDNADYDTAIDRWRRAMANVEDPDTADSLREGIRVAQQRLGVDPDEAPIGQALDEAQGPGVRVDVSLDEALIDRVSSQASVFVIARDMAGELPPLAIAQAQVSDLPATFVLDASNAMSQQANLAQVDEARLMVRVSPTGQATPQPGDLFGDLDKVAVGPVNDGDAVSVVIDSIFE